MTSGRRSCGRSGSRLSEGWTEGFAIARGWRHQLQDFETFPDSTRRATLEQWVRRELADRFRGRLLVIDSRIAARWGTLVGVSEARGQPLPVIDSLIAATSLQ